MVKRPRGDVGIAAEDIAKLLGKAGWEWRRAQGDHIVIAKPGFDLITLSQRVSMLQFKNVERVLGVQLESLLTKQYKRGRGVFLPEAEVRKRLGLAHTMWKSGFPTSFIWRHAGVKGGGTFADFNPALFDTLGFEGVVRKYLRQREEVIERNQPGQPEPAPTARPLDIIEEVRREVPEVRQQVVAAPAEVVPPTHDYDALLDLVQGTLVDMRQVVEARGKRAEVVASALRRVVNLRHHLEVEMEKLQAEVEALLSD